MSRIIVCDTGPLIHLCEANMIHLLKLAGGILIPPAVAAEFRRNLPNEILPEGVRVHEVTPRFSSRATQWIQKDEIDVGEAEAIALALQQRSDWLLTDDAQARQFAERLGLEVHGSIGLLLWAVASGFVENREQAHRMLNGLKRSTLWISERVVAEATAAIDELTAE